MAKNKNKELVEFARLRFGSMEALDREVQAAYDLYAALRSKAYPGFTRKKPRDDRELNAWRRLVMTYIKRGYDVLPTLARVLRMTGYNTPPNIMYSDSILNELVNDYEAILRLTREEILCAVRQVTTRLRRGETLRQALVELSDELSDIFIWCIATMSGLDDIADICRHNALRKLNDKALLQAYREKFPEVITW